MAFQYDVTTPQGLIRTVTSTTNAQSWDFLIYRCTTSATSQATWDKFLSLIRADAEEILSEPEDADLIAGLSMKVIEDPTFEGADWKKARDRFDEWSSRS
jgi:hypothetical protein